MKRMNEKMIDRLLTIGITVCFILLIGFPVFATTLNKQEKKKWGDDCATLRSCIAEAYIKIMQDPNYVYTGTDDQPMLVPEKYYTVTQSALGHGRVYVVVDQNNNVDAYFGTPERNLDYYMWFTGYPSRTRWLLKPIPYIEFVLLVVIIVLSICRSYRDNTKKARRIAESDQETATDKRPRVGKTSGMIVSYSVILLLVSLCMLAWLIIQSFHGASFRGEEVLLWIASQPFIIALSGLLDTVITIWEQKGSARWMTLLTGALSGWLMLDVFLYHLGAWSLHSNFIVLSVLVSLCWVIRNILFRRIEKEDA